MIKKWIIRWLPMLPTFEELYIKRTEETHPDRIIHKPGLWPRKLDSTFLITNFDEIETLNDINKVS